MPGFNDWIEIFRGGLQTDSRGRTKHYSYRDLDRIVNSYNPSVDEAPLIFGHSQDKLKDNEPKDNEPAYGWVKKLKRKGETILAKFRQVPSEVSNIIEKGFYKKRSVSIGSDGKLKHVALLGASRPAIKGLTDIKFSEDEEISVYYFEEATPEKKAIPPYEENEDEPEDPNEDPEEDELEDELDALIAQCEEIDCNLQTNPGIFNKAEAPQVRALFKNFLSKLNSYKTKENDANMPTNMSEQDKKINELELALSTLAGQLEAKDKELTNFKTSEFAEKAREKEKRIAQLEAELEEHKEESRHKDYSDFCEDELGDKLPPVDKSFVIDLFDICHKTGEYEFSEGGKEDAVDRCKDFLKRNLKDHKLFKEIITKKQASSVKGASAYGASSYAENADDDEAQLDQAASDYAEQHNVSYEAALKKVRNKR